MRKKTKNIIKKIAKSHKIKLRFIAVKNYNSSVSSSYDIKSNTIVIVEKIGQKYLYGYELLSVFFHELGHHHCKKHGIWKIYHDQRMSNETHYHYAFRAERWIDRWAEKLYQKHFPNGYYQKSFDSTYLTDRKDEIKKIKNFFKNHYLKNSKKNENNFIVSNNSK